MTMSPYIIINVSSLSDALVLGWRNFQLPWVSEPQGLCVNRCRSATLNDGGNEMFSSLLSYLSECSFRYDRHFLQ